jgi:hypothetical protein
VKVRVVRPGETTYTLSAAWTAMGGCRWTVVVPPELTSGSVMVQRMRHVMCDGGLSTWPKWAYSHTAPGDAVTIGNLERGVDHWQDIPDQPLAGTWYFMPIDIGDCTPPRGNSGWEPACFEVEIGCR